jgi:CHASE3 domain sensor protein
MSPSVPDRTLRRVLMFFAAIAAVLVVAVVVAVRNINRAERGADWVNHTHAVILEIDGVLASTHASDSALRTFLMTGDPRDQAAGREAIGALGEHLAIAKALTRDEPAQHAEVLQLETLAHPRIDLMQRVLAAARTDPAQAIRTLTAADATTATVGEIRRAVEKLKSEEMALLAERDTAAYLQAQATRWTVWLGVALDGLLLGGAAWLIRDDLRARRLAAAALTEANARLETRVRERTADLVATNEKLAAENLEQRWAHQAAEHQLRYYQNVFNALNDLVFIVTKALNVSRVNPAVVTVTGREPSALIDQPLAQFVQLAGDPAGQLDPVARALREGRELRGQMASITDAHGRPAAVRLTLFPVRDRDKVVGGVVVLEVLALDPTSTA